MKKNNTELTVGIAIFLSLFILIAGVLWLKEASLSRKTVRYSILFPNIGSLQVGDPVKVNGVKQGTVTAISLNQTKVAVVITMDAAVRLTDQCIVTVQNVGLMGERMIGIQLAETGATIPPNGKKEIRYIEGRFDTGIAEAMGMLGSVLNEALFLIDTVQSVVHQTVGDPRFITLFSTLVDRIDTMIYSMQHLIDNNETDIRTSITNITAITATLNQFLSHNSGTLNQIVLNGKELSSTALAVTNRADSMSQVLSRLVSEIESGKGSLGVLVKDESMVQNLRKSTQSLDSLLKDINKNGLLIRLKLFGNKNTEEKKRQQ